MELYNILIQKIYSKQKGGVVLNRVNVYQIDCKIYLMKNIHLNYILEEISHFIDLCLGKDEKMLEFHKRRGFKNYVHSGFKELEKSKFYKEGKIYSFSIRCIDEGLKDYFSKILSDVSSDTIKGLATTTKLIPKMYIEKLYTITPALIKLAEGYWKNNINFATYEKRLIENSIKKTKIILSENFQEDFVFYNSIVMLNRKPISNSFKNISLLGDKFEISIADNERAQQIAYILLGTGILENNSRGYGYLNYKSGY